MSVGSCCQLVGDEASGEGQQHCWAKGGGGSGQEGGGGDGTEDGRRAVGEAKHFAVGQPATSPFQEAGLDKDERERKRFEEAALGPSHKNLTHPLHTS